MLTEDNLLVSWAWTGTFVTVYNDNDSNNNNTSLAADYHFQPTAVEMLGPINKSASDFFTVLARKISQRSGDERETVFLFQRISVLLQRFNSILLHDSFVSEDCPE